MLQGTCSRTYKWKALCPGIGVNHDQVWSALCCIAKYLLRKKTVVFHLLNGLVYKHSTGRKMQSKEEKIKKPSTRQDSNPQHFDYERMPKELFWIWIGMRATIKLAFLWIIQKLIELDTFSFQHPPNFFEGSRFRVGTSLVFCQAEPRALKNQARRSLSLPKVITKRPELIQAYFYRQARAWAFESLRLRFSHSWDLFRGKLNAKDQASTKY